MKASERRQVILSKLNNASDPIKANKFASQFGVSRQVIVGDIALLRAANHEIIATNQGYILPALLRKQNRNHFTGKLACQHDASQSETELRLIVDLGGAVEDVIVDHPYYGILKASLTIRNHQDIDQFLQAMIEHDGEMLSSLTNGIHVHTINTPSEDVFLEIKHALQANDILLSEE